MLGKTLICQNASCRFVLDLGQAGPTVKRSSLVVNGCPECGHPWSNLCPQCSEGLEVIWREHRSYCGACDEPLRPAKVQGLLATNSRYNSLQSV